MEKPITEYTAQELFNLANEKAAQEKAQKQSQVSEQLAAGLELLNSCMYVKLTRNETNISLFKFKTDKHAMITLDKYFSRQIEEEVTIENHTARCHDYTVVMLRIPESHSNMAEFEPELMQTGQLSIIDENTYNKYRELYTTCSGIVNKVLTENLAK